MPHKSKEPRSTQQFLGATLIVVPQGRQTELPSIDAAKLQDKFKVLREPNVTDEVLSWFYTILSDVQHNPALVAGSRFAGGPHGPWMFSIPLDLVKDLATLSDSDSIELARTCIGLEVPEFDTWKKPDDLVKLLTRLSGISKDCLRSNSNLVLLLDPSSASSKIALDCKIRQQCLQGDELRAQNKFAEAMAQYEVAIGLIGNAPDVNPELQVRCHFSLGNTQFLCRRYADATRNLKAAVKLAQDADDAPGAIVYFALGCCQFEANNLAEAADSLTASYLTGGWELFASSPKYYEFLLSRASELGRKAKAWNDTLLFLDLHIQEELDNVLAEKTRKLCLEAATLTTDGAYADALDKYWQAYDLIPDQENSLTAIWLIAAIGNVNFLNNDFEAGSDNLKFIGGHPFSFLRLGQCHYELGNMERAADALARAYMTAGASVFEGQDAKYLTFLSSVLQPPAGQDSL